MDSPGQRRKRVVYFYDQHVGNYYYGAGHPMKPQRIRMTHNLIVNYGLYQKLCVVRPRRATNSDMMKFHSDEYVKFLQFLHPDHCDDITRVMQKYNVGEDSPAFAGMYDLCQISAGGSIGAAHHLNLGTTDIAINWAGGMHHAKKSEASGFCYINDIVLGILELLRFHQRVLYLDIDVHHGDGVEEAFFTTDRVMTVSFHKFGEYFPGTGDIADVGAGRGKHYAVNFPLRDGIDDQSYETVFEPVMTKVMEIYQPGVVVMQCGSDSLTGDRLGCFNLTLKGHGKCVQFMKRFNVPLMLVGGGGYTMKNVARCWTYETGIALGVDVPNDLPYSDYYEYFAPEFKLHLTPSSMANQNSKEYLEKIKINVIENLRKVNHAPGIQMQDVPSECIIAGNSGDEDEDMENGSHRRDNAESIQRRRRQPMDQCELYEDEASSRSRSRLDSERNRGTTESGWNRKRRLEEHSTQMATESVRRPLIGGEADRESVDSEALMSDVSSSTTNTRIRSGSNSAEGY